VGIEKIRRKASFLDGATFTGSVGFNGAVAVNTAQTFGGPVTVNGVMTFSKAPILKVPPIFTTGSAAYQMAGILRINSGAVSATASTTAIGSGGFPMLSPIVLGVGVASYNLIGQIVVTTIAQAASGGYFSVGYTGTQNGLALNVDIGWFIINPA
jgi:hypothetical protein